ncbi:MAG TPA: DnaJ domain-containing protein [Nitrospira sp.]|nr:DnaJ domain-containing protein [Nitrospira sp.]
MPVAESKRDYYEVLGVNRTATRDQIKHAYRQLALKYHPDKSQDLDAAAKFREFAEVYAVLSDETKRKEYDTTGHAGVSERWSADDLMRDFQFGDFFGRRMRPGAGAARGADLRYDVELTLEEAARGGDREIRSHDPSPVRIVEGVGPRPARNPCPARIAVEADRSKT